MMYQLTQGQLTVRLSDMAHIPSDPENADYATFLSWVAEGNTPNPVEAPPASQIIADVTNAVQQRLDDFARTRMYDGILSACTYATSTVPAFAAEAQYAVEARDATWAACYRIMARVQSGAQPVPTIEQVLSELPPLKWP